MSLLSLYLLGPPRIERDGVPISFDTRKAVALLSYLAVTGRPHSRDALAALLWPEYSQVNARATLRRTLSTLNKSLGGEWLEISREAIALVSGPGLWIDMAAFEKLVAQCRLRDQAVAESCSQCLQPLNRAAALYRDDFLAGFTLRDSPNFDEWHYFQSEGLRRELAGALERLVACYSQTSEFGTAIPHARRWLALDRLHEPAHRQLMLLYAWSGQRAAALHQYRECRQALEQELGVAPLDATTQLYEALKENRIPPPLLIASASPQQSTSMQRVQAPIPTANGNESSESSESNILSSGQRGAYPLIGRAAEWETMLRAYNAVGADGHLIAIEGEAGIGKTRLAEEFLAHVRAAGAHTLTARCYEGETNLAYGPVASVLRVALSQPGEVGRISSVPDQWLSEGLRLLPELVAARPGLAPPPPLDSPGAQSRFFEGLRQLSGALFGGEQPGVLFFDDLQWADGASLDLLRYIARRLRGWPICLLVTWRTEQAANDNRLSTLVQEAQRAGDATAIRLSRLSLLDVGELVKVAGEGADAIPHGMADRLYNETEGLPFFLIEYLSALAQGRQPPDEALGSVPGGVRDLLRSRLGSVGETGWQLLNTAAVIGRSFDFDTLREASGRGEEEAIEGLEELVGLGLVTEVRDGGARVGLHYDFSHEKLRALVYEETSLARRRLLHRRVAEAMASRAKGGREAGRWAGQIAHHFRQAGNEESAAEYARQAGIHARSLYANAEALAHFRMALALGYPEASDLHEAIGDLQTLLGEYGPALGSYETAASLAGREAPAGIEQKLAGVYGRRGDWEQAESHLEAALAALGAEGTAGERARIYADWSLTAHHRGDVERAGELARQALVEADAANDMQALAQARNMLGILASNLGRRAEARVHLETSLSLSEQLSDPNARAAALNNLALVLGAEGDRGRAVELAEQALALYSAQGDRHREAAMHNNMADLLHASGNREEAMRHLKSAVAIYAEIGVEAGAVQPAIWRLAEW